MREGWIGEEDGEGERKEGEREGIEEEGERRRDGRGRGEEREGKEEEGGKRQNLTIYSSHSIFSSFQCNLIDEATGETGSHSDLSALNKEHTHVFTMSMWDMARKFR